MNTKTIIQELKACYNPRNIEGMSRFGISPKNTYGVPIPILRKMAKDIGKDHKLALELWTTGIHEARILAGMIDNPKLVGSSQMDSWAGDLDSWDTCDQACMNLFRYTKLAHKKAAEWAKDKREFVRRAGFALMAALAAGDKNAVDKDFEKFLPLIKAKATDERNFVKKAVNWALRQIGKRNLRLNKIAIEASKDMLEIGSKSAVWIASDALRELTGKQVQKRLRM